ncbi:MAG: TIGR00645 family protein [Verrucomicrobia bacterium]|nr:TIGR00645 family protein [Verrucomicrobiota bacterium]
MSSHDSNQEPKPSFVESALENSIFASRWLQAPLYLGLIVAQMIYVVQFMRELWHLFHVFFEDKNVEVVSTHIMVGVLGLIDVVMVANLVIMVVIGGYETFVSRLNLDEREDKPEWLSHVNAGVMKIKLGTALISISSIHLLKTFIEVREPGFSGDYKAVMWQAILHSLFLVSAMFLAYTDRVMMHTLRENPKGGH